jgi:hypothetical protein
MTDTRPTTCPTCSSPDPKVMRWHRDSYKGCDPRSYDAWHERKP